MSEMSPTQMTTVLQSRYARAAGDVLVGDQGDNPVGDLVHAGFELL
jgi:hypothetical protein